MRTSLSVFAAVVAVLTVGTVDEASAHARLKSPTPRNNSSGLKTGPCGGIARTNNPHVFEPGQTITVEWEETINHPGYYRIAFSPANDQGFDQNVLANNIPNPTGLQNGMRQVTLPNMECTGCTLQLIQVMTNTNPPSNYYSCADLMLVAPVQDAGTPDAGIPMEDAGTPQMDAGQLVDAGAPDEDAGITEPMADAGGEATHDAGEHGSHGGHEDPADGGTQGLSGISGEPQVGCSAAGGSSALAVVLISLGASFMLRRRRS